MDNYANNLKICLRPFGFEGLLFLKVGQVCSGAPRPGLIEVDTICVRVSYVPGLIEVNTRVMCGDVHPVPAWLTHV